MAKASVVKAIKAKPNGKAIERFNRPLYCNHGHKMKDEQEALVSYPLNSNNSSKPAPVRKCGACFATAPQVMAEAGTNRDAKNKRALTKEQQRTLHTLSKLGVYV